MYTRPSATETPVRERRSGENRVDTCHGGHDLRACQDLGACLKFLPARGQKPVDAALEARSPHSRGKPYTVQRLATAESRTQSRLLPQSTTGNDLPWRPDQPYQPEGPPKHPSRTTSLKVRTALTLLEKSFPMQQSSFVCSGATRARQHLRAALRLCGGPLVEAKLGPTRMCPSRSSTWPSHHHQPGESADGTSGASLESVLPSMIVLLTTPHLASFHGLSCPGQQRDVPEQATLPGRGEE
ncbi:hypothetical protein B0T21DRAFT_353420 [Apiosordaria backusii]|uniref:Uncharacterized protein n=1 Tax=Apiosordaria backusii TaxID=314023 RepID=A0AA39ZSA5_9PEZI|nr:hypothetical protein B0T21DRAFT_353420 [Apiosordaria backusii]